MASRNTKNKHSTFINPLETDLSRGISVAKAIKLLHQNGALDFPQLPSGLFPAANFDNPGSDETGMAQAWLRDSACIATILAESGYIKQSVLAGEGILKCLHKIKQSFVDVITLGQAPKDQIKRPPIRFSGPTSEPRKDWANAQNDALGYSLQIIGKLSSSKEIKLSSLDLKIINLVVEYLSVIQYWQDAESGHWEEIPKVNASSVGTVIAGLNAIAPVMADKSKIKALINKGQKALNDILPNESVSSGLERSADSALVFLIEPQQLIMGQKADEIITNTKNHLMGERGFRRYNGDSYWGPDYREHFMLGDRAADFSDPKDMAIRDSYLTPGGEAQWTFIDPMLSVYYARKYKSQNSQEYAELANFHMVRSLMAIIEHRHELTGQIVWRLPELYFMENGQWVPNDHLGLLWGQANLLYGLNVYAQIFGQHSLIKSSNTLMLENIKSVCKRIMNDGQKK